MTRSIEFRFSQADFQPAHAARIVAFSESFRHDLFIQGGIAAYSGRFFIFGFRMAGMDPPIRTREEA
jgi:hypothetical protein